MRERVDPATEGIAVILNEYIQQEDICRAYRNLIRVIEAAEEALHVAASM